MEKSYWKTDRTTDTKLDKLQIALEVEDIKGDKANTVTQLKRRKVNRRFIQVVSQFILLSCLKNFTIIQILSLGSQQ